MIKIGILSTFLSTLMFANTLVNSSLCRNIDLASNNKDCMFGKSLKGEGIEISLSNTKKIYLLSSHTTLVNSSVFHVWYFNGKRLADYKPTIYFERNKTFKNNIYDMANAFVTNDDFSSKIASVIKLIIKPSKQYRTKSSKLLRKEWLGDWEVRIYDNTTMSALVSYKFKLVK
jgi:hypothetical protein